MRVVTGFVYKMGGHNQFVEEKDKEKGREKKKRKERKKERGNEKNENRERGRKGSRRFDGPRSKVCIFDEGYAPRSRDSSYFGLFSTIRGCF